MPVRTAVVRASIGLHARPAAAFVRAVTETGLPVTISRQGGPAVDARSLLEVMSADFGCGCEVTLEVRADRLPPDAGTTDAERALDGLCALLEVRGG